MANKLTSKVVQDEATRRVSAAFDFPFDGETSFAPPALSVPANYSVGLIVGPSGSGKSTLLGEIGSSQPAAWDNSRAVCSQFASPEDAIARLSGVGFNSIPSWLRPYSALSTGEKFRADLARRLHDDAVIDEFTSVVDRNVAKACAFAARRYITENKLQRVTFASCHYDIIDWLQPDWTFDTKAGVMLPRGSLPERRIEVTPCDASLWSVFRHHHYLSADINRSARCWSAVWNGTLVGFASALAFPNGNFKNAWREHRTVVLPDFQGFGIGVRLSDAVGFIFKAEGCRYFSKTAHPRMGEYRNASPLWTPTSKNMKARPDYTAMRVTKEAAYKHRHAARVAYSHEFMGRA